MREEIYEAYLLTGEELGILLRATGCRGYYGFPIEKTDWSREELLFGLQDMVKKGELLSDGKCFRTETALSSTVRTMATAREMLLITVSEPPLPPYCCYPGEQVLICEWMSRRKDYLKLKQIQAESFLEVLTDEGYFPQMGSGCYRLHDNRTGRLKRKLTLERDGLQQFLWLETKEERIKKPYSKETLMELFNLLTGGEFYDISGCVRPCH